MRKIIKSFGYQTAYYINLLLSALGVFLVIYAAVSLMPIIISTFMETFDINKTLVALLDIRTFWTVGIRVVLVIFGLVLEAVLYAIRIKLRHHTDFNEEGLSKKYSDYDRLSAKDKAEIDKQRLADMERIISSATLRQITHKGPKDPEGDLNKLIGLGNVKQSVHEMAARMQYDRKYRKKKEQTSCMHMCFLGPPGTGKTTIARIMTSFLYRYKYIRKNQCIETDGNFLKGMHAGETGMKTSMLIRKAMGGVLFIDEAYALLDDDSGGYGKEAIATIVKEMEDKRDDLIIIFAGYDKEMKALIDSNPGLQSRIRNYLYFENYTIEELGEIFISMANSEGFCVSADAADKFKARISNEMGKKNFGNARTVRNMLDKIIDRHAVNLMDGVIEKNLSFMICPEDIT